MTTMSYKGYEATVEYGEDAGTFDSEIANLRDVVTFQGRSVAELERALAASVEDYLAFCKERGEEPETAREPRGRERADILDEEDEFPGDLGFARALR